MSKSLRSWQENALNKVVEKFNREEQKLFLTHATPGGGKTIHALSTLSELIRQGVVTHVVVLAPSTMLVTQWATEAKTEYGMELKNSMLYNQMADFHEYHGMVMTYQAMNECAESIRIFCANNKVLVIADEIHHVADGQSWGDSFRLAFELSKHILALTGTPWASNGKRIAYVNYGDDGYSIPDFSYDKKTAIAQSVCRVTQFFKHTANDLRFIDNETGEITEYPTLQVALDVDERGAYRKTLESLKHMRSIFVKADEQLNQLRTVISDAGGLIVAPSIESAHLFKDELFMLTGIDFPIVHSKMDGSHTAISEFRKSSDRWLISVDMVTEGVDIKRLMVCVFLSIKNTELFVRQVIGRIERVRYSSKVSDTAGYFHYTDERELNEIIGRLEGENNQGIALKKQVPPVTRGSNGNSFDDGVTLEDLQTQQAGLIANGYSYPDDVVVEAMLMKSKNVRISYMPLYMVCDVVIASRESQGAPSPSPEYFNESPLTEKKSRIRSRISKEMNRKLYKHFSGNVSRDQISAAHYKINTMFGITKTDDNVPLDQLETKLQYVTNSGVQSWL